MSSKSTDIESKKLAGEQVHDVIEKESRFSTSDEDDLYSLSDSILDRKMHLVNKAINDIGFTNYHWKLFCLNGMGYAVDSLLMLLQSLNGTQIKLEFNLAYNPLVSANYVGLFCGALFWGFTADLIGRKTAFKVTLFICALFSMAAAGGLNIIAVCSLSCISYWGGGGNLVLDSVTFLEFLPANKQYLVTLMAAWWGVGQTIACLIAWPLITNFSCASADDCPRASNMGWRYVYIACGGLVLLIAAARVLVIKMVESPKFELSNGNDAGVIATLETLSRSAGIPCPLTLEELEAVGTIQNDNSEQSWKDKINVKNIGRVFKFHFKGLFGTKKMALNTSLNFLSWILIGITYPLFTVFLPEYLSSRGANQGDGSLYTTYRNDLISNSVSILGPIIAAPFVEIPKVGRRGTMAAGALITMALMFGYTAVRTQAQNVGLAAAISCSICIYYGTLFAYTPESMPSHHRAFGYGMSVSCARAVSTISPVIAYYANTSSAAPVYVLAALFGATAIVSMCFPYEIVGRNSV